ncbi:MAG: hypothetical protein CBE24_05425 [bacterium TMED264]|nr:MAG: hypothetical protein CBE24_05425 [bacterium TMED264]
MLNLSQSGHPGGSRSKVHALVFTLLSGAMKWDIRDAGKRFSDRFILVAGHCNPVVYAALAVFNEALRLSYKAKEDKKFLHFKGQDFQLTWEDLLNLRQNGGLPGHAEMQGKTLFFKANTGPTGHGSPFAAGAALALKYSNSTDVKVFAMEGEGGITAGASHETINSAWGLGLGNLIYHLDWNDYGIDNRPFSSILYGGPENWFGGHGWQVLGVEDGECWDEIANAYYNILVKNPDPHKPKVIYSKTRKGRGYHKYDSHSHGSPHKRNSILFWKTKEDFMNKYGVSFENFGSPEGGDREEHVRQASSMFKTVFSVMSNNVDLVNYLSDRLISLGDSIPKQIEECTINTENKFKYKKLFNVDRLPDNLFVSPGKKAPNRAGFSKYASYINTISEQKYGRPLILAMSADLSGSTNISGFAKGYDGADDKGFYEKTSNIKSPLFPQGITEFTNAGMMAGASTVNFSTEPYESFSGYYGAVSTYGSFSYLKYGPLRLFSQLAQDSELKVGKIIWVVGHSGPETAEDSRTHYGIFAPGVTQLFPNGSIINIHPWEHNEVAPSLAAALKTDVPIVAVHLTRPSIVIPDRKKMGIANYKDSAKGAYIIKNYESKGAKMGIVIIRGTAPTNSLMKILPVLKKKGPNIKIIAAVSMELFKAQNQEYQESIISPSEWNDCMIITNTSLKNMRNWIKNRFVEKYSLSPDFDNRWRTGGSVDQITVESGLDSLSILNGIKCFSNEREERLFLIKKEIPNY